MLMTRYRSRQSWHGTHRTQYPDEAVQRVTGAMRDVYKGELLLTSMTQPSPASDLFR
jgi:hypothetical protein